MNLDLNGHLEFFPLAIFIVVGIKVSCSKSDTYPEQTRHLHNKLEQILNIQRRDNNCT